MAGLLPLEEVRHKEVVHYAISDESPSKKRNGSIYSKPKECNSSLIKKAENRLEQYSSCRNSDECEHVKYGFITMTATNKQHREIVQGIVNDLERSCGPRKSHDSFYSDHGIEVVCNAERGHCSVNEITTEIEYRRLKEKTFEVFSNSEH